MSIKFTPLPSGQWGVRVFGSDARLFRSGDPVRVVKSNGEEKAVTLDSMVAGEGTDTETWSIVETKPVSNAQSYRGRRATSRTKAAPAPAPTGQRLDLGDVVIEITTTAPVESDAETLARIFGSLASSADGEARAS